MKSYKDLDIYNLSVEYAIDIHRLSLELPRFELFEQGSQIRRSSKSISSNIVEGYGRRRYKQEFVRFLTYAHASALESLSQLEVLNALYEKPQFALYMKKYDELSAKIYKFIRYVNANWNTDISN